MWSSEICPDIAKYLLEDKLSLVENHCSNVYLLYLGKMETVYSVEEKPQGTWFKGNLENNFV